MGRLESLLMENHRRSELLCTLIPMTLPPLPFDSEGDGTPSTLQQQSETQQDMGALSR
jgi:hypothetical protein